MEATFLYLAEQTSFGKKPKTLRFWIPFFLEPLLSIKEDRKFQDIVAINFDSILQEIEKRVLLFLSFILKVNTIRFKCEYFV